jgi:hypothetical protein
MIVYKDYETFIVMGQEVNLISDETDYGLNTIAEVDGDFHYLGSENPGVSAAIFAWQEINGRLLNERELHQVMVDNHLISAAI